MGATKRVAEQVAAEMGIEDPNDPRVVAEADLRLRTARRADTIASRRYNQPFEELPAAAQMRVWTEAEHRVGGLWGGDGDPCPHYKGYDGGVGGCRENELRACDHELGTPCEVWLTLLAEWQEEKGAARRTLPVGGTPIGGTWDEIFPPGFPGKWSETRSAYRG